MDWSLPPMPMLPMYNSSNNMSRLHPSFPSLPNNTVHASLPNGLDARRLRQGEQSKRAQGEAGDG
jgi:hypothetical protein